MHKNLWAVLAATILCLAVPLQLPAQTYTTFDAPAAIATIPNSVTQSGVVAGYYIDVSRVSHGFLRAADGTFTTIDVPGAGTGGFAETPIGVFFQGTTANAINQAGTIT